MGELLKESHVSQERYSGTRLMLYDLGFGNRNTRCHNPG